MSALRRYGGKLEHVVTLTRQRVEETIQVRARITARFMRTGARHDTVCPNCQARKFR